MSYRIPISRKKSEQTSDILKVKIPKKYQAEPFIDGFMESKGTLKMLGIKKVQFKQGKKTIIEKI
jgi:hypothetical protein